MGRITTKVRQGDWKSISKAVDQLASAKLGTGASPVFNSIIIVGSSGGSSPTPTNQYITIDANGNLVLSDSVVGARTLKQLGCPTYKFIKATGKSEGNLHLSDASTWAVSKSLIKYIRVTTASTDWDLYVLQNDNGYATNDANIPMIKVANGLSGNANLWLDLPYEDEDASDEVHLYYNDISGTNTASFYILGMEML